MKIKLVARTVTYDKDKNKILLVKNKGTNFWYPPGGGWEYETENILECAKREVFEETGFRVDVKRMIYAQEFHESPESIFFETFWVAEPSHEQTLNENHIDLDPNGNVEVAQWFGKEELQDLKVFPKRLKNTFWENVSTFLTKEDPFIGVS
jgi:8-oxo-dGTP pyrophosphatase MutT (NUDIX family)